ncbi:MAG TPA: serine hydrolase [Candidatus Hydrogenedentes bacterium]|nr:serine hydrolase [Candidatus Hydrogenedentota bacterium]
MTRRAVALFVILVLISVTVTARAADKRLLFDVPRLEGIVIDGDPVDWGDGAFRVDIMTTPDVELLPPDDFRPRFQLAWSGLGLLLLVRVSDDIPVEGTDPGSLWMKDCIEVFVGGRLGQGGYYQAVVAPGRDPSHPELRYKFYDFRTTEEKPELTIEAAATHSRAGYVLEVLFPWSNLAIAPGLGYEVALQLFIDDADGPDDRYQQRWFPDVSANISNLMHRVRLAEQGSPAVRAKARAACVDAEHARLIVDSVPELAGKRIKVKAGKRTLGKGIVGDADGYGRARVLVPIDGKGKTLDRATVHSQGTELCSVALPDPAEARAKMLTEAKLRLKPFVFTGADFPACDFEDPQEVAKFLREYAIKTTYYDKTYTLVSKAESPGRYGAVIDIVPEDGRPIRRFRTLFRLPESAEAFPWWTFDSSASILLPPAYGIDPAVLREHKRNVSDYLGMLFFENLGKSTSGATLLAGLYEGLPMGREAGAFEDVDAVDRQWRVGLKRQLFGTAERWPGAFICPRPIEGKPAPILRKGSEKEAGVKPGAGKRIDAVLRAWAADSDEAFAACVARNGVVFLHEAYGQRDGRPMTTTTKSWMASLTKLLSATLMMMLVDQDLVGLDDTVDTFLPPFRDIEAPKPLTVGNLYNHTGGLWGHWGDDLHDFEEVIAGYYPFLKVGEEFVYDGAGPALGSKIIETISGEALPMFYRKHLLEPLGCTNTDVTNSSYDAQSVPEDMAKVGQMLLNGGAYGDMRFFSPETLEQMLPRKLTKELGERGENIVWGIGTMALPEKGLGERTFAHSAASAATLRIDPETGLVISMTRNGAGANFAEYHEKFIAAIVDNLVD